MNTTFLGPFGSTFSHQAYEKLALTYGALPTAEHNFINAVHNSDILGITISHGGYSCLAMETKAGGRVSEPLESFIRLLNKPCPIHIIGALAMRIDFCLMGKDLNLRKRIIAHPKALEACADAIRIIGRPTIQASSNGEAARLVSQDPSYADCLALGPASAGKKYGLNIYNPDFAGNQAMTTFFLIGPENHPVKVGKKNRALIVYKACHRPGSLVRSLLPFEEYDLNLIQIHSMHTGNCSYNFAIEIDVDQDKVDAFAKATQKFKTSVEDYLCFGPFEVLSE